MVVMGRERDMRKVASYLLPIRKKENQSLFFSG